MSQMRKDPTSGRWVIISEERQLRPTDYTIDRDEFLPSGFRNFDCGEKDIPFILSSRAKKRSQENLPFTPFWGDKNQVIRKAMGLYDMMDGTGIHKLLSPDPLENDPYFKSKPLDIEEYLILIRRCARELGKEKNIRHIMVLRDYGHKSGSPFSNIPTQILTLPLLPKRIDEQLKSFAQYFEEHERCLFCDINAKEMWEKQRIITMNRHFLALCPYSSSGPFEISVIPLKHGDSFESITDSQIKALALMLKSVFHSIEKTLNSPDYNMIFHWRMKGGKNTGPFHWYIQFLPRLVNQGAFEWGTGFYINPTPPEEAALRYKSGLNSEEE